MKVSKIAIFVATLGSLATSLPLLAHHAFEAEFDDKKNVTMTGVMTKVDWVNPHIYVYMDVKDSSGKVTNVKFESVPPLMMRKGGLERTMLTLGQTFTIDGYGPKDGSTNLVWLKTLHFPDGRTIDILRDEKKEAQK